MKKSRNIFNYAVISMFLIAFSFSVVTAFFNVVASIVELGITTLTFGAAVFLSRKLRQEAYAFFGVVEQSLSPESRQALQLLPLPVCLLNDQEEFVWYNDRFSVEVLGGENAYALPFESRFHIKAQAYEDLSYKEKRFTVLSSLLENGNETLKILYFLENTDLKNAADRFLQKRPAVLHILIDNYEELINSISGSEKNFIGSRIESILEKTLVSEAGGFLRKLEKDRFVAIIDSTHLEKLIENKFELLGRVHKATASGHLFATLSIGIGKGADDLRSSDTMARQALDMALGRGGDQVAVKSDHGFEFFGGLSKGVEKRAKVRSRMIASALRELLGECDNVVLMGHKMSDFDCVGAAAGLYRAISETQKPVHICLDRDATLAGELIEHLCQNGCEAAFITPQQAREAVGRHTLLIVLDTHNPDFVEYPPLLDAAGDIVIIDHHRKMVRFIENAVIFYHEPNASSTCEMVTELLQYFSENAVIARPIAEALLAGIMLDTKNFIVKSGVRTFEAAAVLRRSGADLIRVNGWFASSIETYHQRAQLIAAAEIVHGCAIACQDRYCDALPLAAPQTADELLHMRSVFATFVLYLHDGIVSISARSYGAVNVQLIMEKLGGGGHLTMAGAQIPAESCEPVRQQLLAVLSEYFEENPPAGSEGRR